MPHRLRRWLLTTLLACPSAAWAQAASSEQLQKALDDANSQLKSAQDRKNELALENQKLQKQLEELRGQSEQTRQRLETIEYRAYFMREHYAAWELFVEANPALRAMWVAYFTGLETPNRIADLLGDGRWPFGLPERQVSVLTGEED